MEILYSILTDLIFVLLLIASYFILTFTISNTLGEILNINFLSFYELELLSEIYFTPLCTLLIGLVVISPLFSLAVISSVYSEFFYHIGFQLKSIETYGVKLLLNETFDSFVFKPLFGLILIAPFLLLTVIGLTYSEIFYLIGYQLNIIDIILVIITFFGVIFSLGFSAYNDAVPLIVNTLLITVGMTISYFKL